MITVGDTGEGIRVAGHGMVTIENGYRVAKGLDLITATGPPGQVWVPSVNPESNRS